MSAARKKKLGKNPKTEKEAEKGEKRELQERWGTAPRCKRKMAQTMRDMRRGNCNREEKKEGFERERYQHERDLFPRSLAHK